MIKYIINVDLPYKNILINISGLIFQKSSQTIFCPLSLVRAAQC